MKKKYIILIIFAFITALFFYKIDSVRKAAKNYLSESSKNYLKIIFYGKSRVKEINDLRFYKLMNYNQALVPETQFINIDLKIVKLANFYDGNKTPQTFYVDFIKNNLMTVDSAGNFFLIDFPSLKNLDNNKWAKLNTNLKFDNKKVFNLLSVEDNIFISYSEKKSEDCKTINIAKAKASDRELNFDLIYKSKECQKDYGSGRLAAYNFNGKDGLLMTVDVDGAYLQDAKLRDKAQERAQDPDSIFGKIIFVDFETKKHEIFSLGHRTPQGLLVYNNNIIATEHGPKGGDEINKIEYKKNYGWPIVSYGDLYGHQIEEDFDGTNYYYLKKHLKNGFEEPIFSFVPSIGMSQIIHVPDSFSKKWQNNFLVTSLNGGSIYRVLFDENFSKLIYLEKIFIGDRIRDIEYSKELNTFILAMEGNGGSIGILKNLAE
tara:strand:+ start:219 stop:1514 length:1296 start_codon:yes stop_codon:yes gene_type:complete